MLVLLLANFACLAADRLKSHKNKFDRKANKKSRVASGDTASDKL